MVKGFRPGRGPAVPYKPFLYCIVLYCIVLYCSVLYCIDCIVYIVCIVYKQYKQMD